MRSIRRVTEGDVELVRRLRLRAVADAPYAFSATYESLVNRPMEVWRARVQAWVKADVETCFLGFQGDAVSGMCGVECGDAPRANLVALWVEPALRGTGLAKDLVEVVCAFARRARATEISAWVFEENDRARRFYEGVGFVAQTDRRPCAPDPAREEILSVRTL